MQKLTFYIPQEEEREIELHFNGTPSVFLTAVKLKKAVKEYMEKEGAVFKNIALCTSYKPSNKEAQNLVSNILITGSMGPTADTLKLTVELFMANGDREAFSSLNLEECPLSELLKKADEYIEKIKNKGDNGTRQ